MTKTTRIILAALLGVNALGAFLFLGYSIGNADSAPEYRAVTVSVSDLAPERADAIVKDRQASVAALADFGARMNNNASDLRNAVDELNRAHADMLDAMAPGE